MYKFTRISTCLTLAILPILPIYAAGFLGIPDAHPYVGINLRLASVQASGTSQTQTPYESNPETFTTHHTKQATQYAIVGGVNIPRASAAASPWFTAYQVEASLWQLRGATVNGVHNINNPPIFNNANYNYHYALQLQAVSLDASVNVYQWRKWSPFVGAGVDVGQAAMSNYQEDTTGLTFANKTSSLFMYHARLGVRYELPKQWQAQFAYTYYPAVKVNTGAGSTGYANVPSLQNTISISNIGLTLSYQF